MSLISIIKELQISKKTIFFSVLGQTYYFLIAFFLFKGELIDMLDERLLYDKHFYYIFCISFIMSSFWFLINVSISAFVLMFHHSNTKYNDNPSGIFINSMFCSIGYLSCSMLLNFLLDYDFEYFIIYSFSFISIRVLWVIMKSLILKKNHFKFYTLFTVFLRFKRLLLTF